MATITILPQQKLLLELLIVSGEIAVPEGAEGTLLGSTLHECREAGWLRITEISPGVQRVAITTLGRMAVK
ncbi:MAG: hypothetical protein ACE5H8_05115 [Alphaproteobacteria bacterium]